jgi:hypothetical protein
MTDKKITNLTNIVAADLVDADEFVVVDISADETMALTLGELKTAVGGGAGDLLAANNLSDLANAGTARTNLGLGTTDSPTFAGLTTTADVSFGDNVTVSGIQPKITITETDTSAQHRILSSSGALYIQAEDSDGTDDGDLHLTGMSNNDLRVLNIKAANTYINGNLDVTGDVAFADGGKATFGAGDDLQIFHSGTSSFIRDVGGGDLQIFASDDVFIRGYDTSSYMARFAEAGAVTLYHNNVEKFATSSTGVEVTGNATFADNGKATFGDGADLQIFHTGSSSWIRDLGTGGLTIDTNGTVIDLKGSSPTEYMARFIKDGAVSLYHNGSPKLATTATGVDVTGTVTATTVDLGNWTVTESSGVLYFATGGVNKMKLESSGDLTVVGNITAYGTI